MVEGWLVVTIVLEDDGVNLPRMRKTNNSNIPENYIQKLRKLLFTPRMHTQRGFVRLSVCLSVR